MIQECKTYLIEKLKDAGIKTEVFTSLKKLTQTLESHVGAVLNENESFSRNGSKKNFVNEDGATVKRTKVFDRSTTLSVVIGEYDLDKCEKIFNKFMSSLDQGLVIDGNFVTVSIEEADWVEKEDSLLKAKVAVQFKVTFDGGIYRDSIGKKISDIDIQVSQ